MNTVARLWLLLTAFFALAHGILFILVWRTVDLRLEIIVQYIAVPFLQAAGLAWVAGAFHLKDCARAVRQICSRPVAALLWCAEGVLLFLYWGPGSGTDLTEMVARTAAFGALLAVVIILIRILPGAGFRTWMAILPFAGVASAMGTNGIHPWFNVLFQWLPDGWSLLLKQMVILGLTVVFFIGFAGKAQSLLAGRRPLAGMMLGWVQLFFLVAAMALAVNGYLFDVLVSPWREIIATFLSLAATSLLTAALFLFTKQKPNQENISSAGSQILKHYPGFMGLWAVLAICAVAATVLLRIFFFPHWDWNLKALLPLALIPLVQASWLRWAHALRAHWRMIFRLARGRPFLSALLLAEIILFCAVAFPQDLWENQSFSAAVTVWVGLKLIILGGVLLKATVSDGPGKTLRGVYGGGTLICGIGAVCIGRFPNAQWMMAALGSAFILLEVRRPVHPADTVGLAGAAAEACLMPILVMALCTLLTRAYPMDPLPWVAYSLVAFSTTSLALLIPLPSAQK
ncbi:MAG: hypothetical protein K9N21_13875 [Deltaproteobacteria bacterium]|nr:hypothetical protein [Deltaproteobacteria bacterium]